jgi:uncharacterized membrane protein
MFREVAEFIAVLACGLFAGAALYVSLVEHPARMECGVETAITVFGPSYRRATVLQVTLAALGLLSSLVAWLSGATFWWLVVGLMLSSVIPFTLVVILPTNRQLISPALDRRSANASRLLSRWALFHAVRTVISSLALTLFLYLLIFARTSVWVH